MAVIQGVFLFTADQERVHAKQFYSALEDCAGQTVKVDGTYPVDIYSGPAPEKRPFSGRRRGISSRAAAFWGSLSK